MFAAIPQTPEYLAYADTHWRKLIARYQPDLLWNDIGYPAAADLDGLFAEYYAAVPEGVVKTGSTGSPRRPGRSTATSSPPSTRPRAIPTASGRTPAGSARRSASTARSPRTPTSRSEEHTSEPSH